jgi:hypothetical protein
MNKTEEKIEFTAILPGPDGGFVPCPSVMTEEELIRFLRIPEISNARNHRNVVENLKRTRGLPRVHLCGKAVYLTDAVKVWLENHLTYGQ